MTIQNFGNIPAAPIAPAKSSDQAVEELVIEIVSFDSKGRKDTRQVPLSAYLAPQD